MNLNSYTILNNKLKYSKINKDLNKFVIDSLYYNVELELRGNFNNYYIKDEYKRDIFSIINKLRRNKVYYYKISEYLNSLNYYSLKNKKFNYKIVERFYKSIIKTNNKRNNIVKRIVKLNLNIRDI
jgi:hypothetical protein